MLLPNRGLSRCPSQRIDQKCTLKGSRHVVVTASAAPVVDTEFAWTGSDEFSHLEDRKDLPPLPLPAITSRKRVVLVRHGQSTWNAEGRIQGSSNFSCLTAKGTAQAETTRDLVSPQTSSECRSRTAQHSSTCRAPIWIITVVSCSPCLASAAVLRPGVY